MRSIVTLASYVALGLVSAMAQDSPPASAPQAPHQGTPSPARLTSSEIRRLQAKAEAGDPSAQAVLGKAYQDGNGVPQDNGLALRWMRKAADQGDAVAENDLGIAYSIGRGVSKDREEAVRWYHKAAKLGNSRAMFNLGASYYNGDGVPSDPTLAYAWFLLAQAAGNPTAEDAVKRSAEEGENLGATLDALQLVAAMYEKGDDLQQSYSEAAKWYRKAADQKSAQAMVKLAAMFIDGRGVPQDYSQAMDLCRSAAKQNFASGDYCVAYMFQRGLGVPADPKEAAKWYREASAHGDVRAMRDLGDIYFTGKGVPVDRPEAYYFLFLAHTRGSPDAKAQADIVWRGMSQDEIKTLEKKLRGLRLDPKKVFAIMQGTEKPPD